MFFSPCPACGMLCGDSPATHTSSLPKLSPCRCGFGGRLAYCSLASIRRGATCSVLRAKLTRPRATPTSTTARNAGPSGPPMGRVTSAPTRGCFLATAASVSATRNRATRMMARGFCSRPGGGFEQCTWSPQTTSRDGRGVCFGRPPVDACGCSYTQPRTIGLIQTPGGNRGKAVRFF